MTLYRINTYQGRQLVRLGVRRMTMEDARDVLAGIEGIALAPSGLTGSVGQMRYVIAEAR
jgi:hypothetical protein